MLYIVEPSGGKIFLKQKFNTCYRENFPIYGIALSPLSAFATNVLILLHICWGVLWFDGWEQRGLRGWVQIFMTFFSHMLVAGLVSFKIVFVEQDEVHNVTFNTSVCVHALVTCLPS